MKGKLLLLLFLLSGTCFGQYIAVTVKYTDTRLVNNDPEPPTRENRLVLYFYEVSPTGVWTPANLNNYDLWIYKTGLQYGSLWGGILDSNGNNYPNYAWTAPRAVAYYNSYGMGYIDCSPFFTTHYTVNGSTLDVGYIPVSSWENGNETFTAPNICLPYYDWTSPYAFSPGNINFNWPLGLPPGPPYNWYSFACAGSTQQLVIRGLLPEDTMTIVNALPVHFANVAATIDDNVVEISWSNLTESNILHYLIERSEDGQTFRTVLTQIPTGNNQQRTDYLARTIQNEKKIYYRIKAVETSGTFFYSEVISVNRTLEDQALKIYPNPVNQGTLTVRLTNAHIGRYLLILVTTEGKQLKQKMIEHDRTGDLVWQINLEGILPGLYKLVLRGEQEKFSQTILVKN